MSVYLQCRVCRNPVVKEDHLVDGYKSEFKVCDNSAVWYIRDDNMPDWVSEAVIKESWQKGKLCCPKCNGKLGSFNFIKILTCQQCDKHDLPPVHILKDRVDRKILAVKAESSTSPDTCNMETNASIESNDQVFTPSSESMDQVFTPSSESMHQVFTPSSKYTKCVLDSVRDRINHDQTNTCNRTSISEDHQHVTSFLGDQVVNTDEFLVCPEILSQHKTDSLNHDKSLIDDDDDMINQVDGDGSDVDDENSDFCPEDFIKIRDGEFLYETTLEQKRTNFDPYKEMSQNDLDGFPASSKDHHVDKTVKFSCLTGVDQNNLMTYKEYMNEWSDSNLEHNQDQSNKKLGRVQDYVQNTMAMSFKTNCDTFQMHPRPIGNEHTRTFDFSDQMNNLEPLSDPHIQSSSNLEPSNDPHIQSGSNLEPSNDPLIQSGSNLEPSNDPHIQSGSGEGNTVTNNVHHLLQDLSSTVVTESSQITNRTPVEETNGIQVEQQTNGILTEPFGYQQENITHSDSRELDHQHFIATNAEIFIEEFESESFSSQVPGDNMLQSSVDSIREDQSIFEESPVPDGEDEDVDVDIPVDFLMFSERSRRRRPNRRSRRENRGKRKEKKEQPKKEIVYETWLIDFPEEHLCPVCFDLFCEPHACSPCEHVLCEACLRRVGHKNVYNTPCPMCRQLILQCIKKTDLVKTLKDLYPDEYRSRLREQRKYLNDKFSPLPHRRTALGQTQEDIRNRILGQRNNLQPQRAKIYLAGFVLLIMIVPVVSLGKAVVNSAIGLVQDLWTWF